MNVELDRIIDKVKKCIALSKSDNPHEAAAALRQAQALMRKHGIDEAGIAASEISAADVEHKSGNTARPPAWETMLMMLIGTAFGCKGRGREFHGGTRARQPGHPSRDTLLGRAGPD